MRWLPKNLSKLKLYLELQSNSGSIWKQVQLPGVLEMGKASVRVRNQTGMPGTGGDRQ